MDSLDLRGHLVLLERMDCQDILASVVSRDFMAKLAHQGLLGLWDHRETQEKLVQWEKEVTQAPLAPLVNKDYQVLLVEKVPRAILALVASQAKMVHLD